VTETSSEHALESARARLGAGEFERAREAALAGLSANPDDPALLQIAGRASLELGLDDAPGYLDRASAAGSSDPATWRELGADFASLGRLEDAREAFRRAVELLPDDPGALLGAGLASLATGRTGDAVAYLKQAAQLDPESEAALRGLLEIHRRDGRLGEALTAALRVEERSPADPVAPLDVAEICLALGRFDEASAAFTRLRSIDEEPEHEVYAYHGLIEVEILRGHMRRALDLTVDATKVDRLGRTTDVLAFVVAQVFGERDRPGPDRPEVEALLASSRAEHRRLHAEAVVA
jgi:tetratricopeptide (TPR) repeat protein